MSFEIMSNCIGSGGFVDVDQSGHVTSDCFIAVGNKKIVGGYDITGIGGGTGSIVFNMTKKPLLIHRFFCRILLGWKWVNEKK